VPYYPALLVPLGEAYPANVAVLGRSPRKFREPSARELRRTYLLRDSLNRPFGFASHGDDDFSSSVSFFQMPDGLGDLAQRVRPVDDRCDLAGFD
jgi:hypothetical protein